MSTIHIIHENNEWLEPLRGELNALGLPWREWFMAEGFVDLHKEAPEGVYYNRMSASSHTRGHRLSLDLTAPLLSWVEFHGRRLVNSRRALQLESSKAEQLLALQAHGIRTPHTNIINDRRELLDAAYRIGYPLIVKPNRGGKGTGVQLIHSLAELSYAAAHYEDWSSPDGINLVQQYVKPADGSITRVEFIGGDFYYAVRVDATGGFELCPADACEIPLNKASSDLTLVNPAGAANEPAATLNSAGDAFCPVGTAGASADKFSVIQNYSNPDIEKYERFLLANGIEVAALEYVRAEDGTRYVYDVNVNTNYNRRAEQAAGTVNGMRRLAEFLGRELQAQQRKGSAARLLEVV